MNVVFLSPHFPPQFYLFCAALREQGATVLGIGDAPYHELRPELHQSMDDYVHVPDSNGYEGLFRAVAYLSSRHGKIDRIDSLNEYWLAMEAKLREDFNVFGPKPPDTDKSRSKSAMRETFMGAGVPCTVGEKVTSPEQVRAFAAKHGFPLVFKPDVGVGADRTFKVSGEAALEDALTNGLPNYVVEKFVQGAITSYDGLTDHDGNIVFSISHVYSSGIMEVVTGGLAIHYYSRRDIPPMLEQLGRKVVKAFNVRERFFHIEFFEQPDGKFIALEINVRPPGGFTTDLMNYSCDLSIYQLWAKALTGKDLSGFKFERKFHTAHAARRFNKNYQIPDHELTERLGGLLVLQRPLPPVFAGAMGDVMYVLRDPEMKHLKEGIALVEALAN